MILLCVRRKLRTCGETFFVHEIRRGFEKAHALALLLTKFHEAGIRFGCRRSPRSVVK